MSTNSDVIADALRELGVITEVQTPSAEQAAHALRKLNQLAAELEGQIGPIQWFEQTDTSADFPLAAEFENAFTSMLATRLAPNYGASVSVELAAAAMAGMQHFLNVHVCAALKPAEMADQPFGTGDRLNPFFSWLTG